MDTNIKEQFNQIADKLENYFFPEEAGEDQTQYFQSFFTDSYVFPTNLVKYFRQEIFLGFIFNVLLFAVFIVYIPINYDYCWQCNALMTIWLFFLCLLNAIILIPKILLVRKLFQIEYTNDIYTANYLLWMFFRSRVYKYNITMSRYVFCTYIVGSIFLLLSWGDEQGCDRFYGLIGILLGSFIIRVVSSFLKFIHSFNNPQHAENFMDYFKGVSQNQIQSLKLVTHKEYCESLNREEEDCPICYESYDSDDTLRMMECPGNHAFHKKCIDKWLLKSNKCPKCNIDVFVQRQKSEDNKQD